MPKPAQISPPAKIPPGRISSFDYAFEEHTLLAQHPQVGSNYLIMRSKNTLFLVTLPKPKYNQVGSNLFDYEFEEHTLFSHTNPSQ